MSKKPTVTMASLWLKERPDGRFYLTGRMGASRLIIRPIEDRAEGTPEYTLEIAETDDTVAPVRQPWRNRQGGV